MKWDFGGDEAICMEADAGGGGGGGGAWRLEI